MDADTVFVFGSNLAGVHGAGSAKEALRNWGAVWGQGVGFQGRSYAIPTKDRGLNVLTIPEISMYVKDFLDYARQHPGLIFKVAKVGCGLAGYDEWQISPMFRGAPENCVLPEGWR